MSCTSGNPQNKRRSWRTSFSSLFSRKKTVRQDQGQPTASRGAPARQNTVTSRPQSGRVSSSLSRSRSHRLSRAIDPERAEWDVLVSPSTSTSSGQSMPPIPNKYRQSVVPPHVIIKDEDVSNHALEAGGLPLMLFQEVFYL
jgi:hypothetical protein